MTTSTRPIAADRPVVRRSARPEPIWNVSPRMLAELLPAFAAVVIAVAGWDVLPRGAILGVCVAAMWVIAIRAPAVALAVIFAAAPWYHDVGDGSIKVATADLLLVGVAPVVLVRWLRSNRPVVFGPMAFSLLAYIGACVVITIANPVDAVALRNVAQMLLYLAGVVGVVAYGLSRPDELDLAYWSYIASVLVVAVAVLSTGQMFVLGMHKNAVGGVLSVGIVIATHLILHARELKRTHWLATFILAVMTAAIVVSASRGAWVGAILGVGAVLIAHKKAKLALRVTAVLVVVAVIGWMLMPEERREYASSFDSERWNIKLRYKSAEYAWELFQEAPLTGNGLQLRDGYDATNVVLLSLAESGVVGFAALVSMWVTFGVCAYSMSRRVPVGTAHFSLIAIGIGVMVCKIGHGMFDHYWGRGLTVPWAGAGMLIAAWGMLYARPMRSRLRQGFQVARPVRR
jgi:hypothetical protein